MKEDDRNGTTDSAGSKTTGKGFSRTNRLVQGAIRDLRLSQEDLNVLKQAGVETLKDWTIHRDKARIDPTAKATLDAHTRLVGLGASPEVARQLFAAGIDSGISLAILSEADRIKLESELGLPANSLKNLQLQSQTLTNQLFGAFVSGLITGTVPIWFDLKEPAVCGVCREDTSIVGRPAYFRYLIRQTGKTRADLRSVVHQNWDSLSPITTLAQITICNEVLASRYPGALTDQEAAAGRRTLLLAYLSLFSGSLLQLAQRLISEGSLASNAADLESKLRSLVEGSTEIVPTGAEITACQAVALADFKSQVQADPDFTSLSNSEIEGEASRRLEEILAPARRRAAELDRESLKRRSGSPPKSDHQLFRELYIEPGLGSCEDTTRLDQAIYSVQAYLDDRGAADGLSINGHAYLTYEQWRGDQLGQFYPELRSFLRDDVLSGEEDSWDRGSIIKARNSSRDFIRTQLNSVKSAIQDGFLVESDELQSLVDGSETAETLGLVPFKASAYFHRFQEGLQVLDLILDADDKVAKATTALDSDEPGLAIAHLNDAVAALNHMGEIAFSEGSELLTTWRSDYRELATLPTEERRALLSRVFNELFTDIKRLYQARAEGELSIPGLNLATGLVDDWSKWSKSGVVSNISLSSGSIKFHNVPTPPEGSTEEARANNLNRASLLNTPLSDVQFVTLFEIGSTTSSRAPAVTDHYAPGHYEMAGLMVRRQESGAQYRIVVETALTNNERMRLSSGVSDEEQPPPPPYWWTLSIRKVPAGGGRGDVLATLDSSERFKIVKNSPYVLTVNTVGTEIRAELATPDGLHRSLRVSDTSASPLNSGSFGVRATTTVNVRFGPIHVESVTRYSVPPFYADRGGSFYYLRSESIYDDHQNGGAGMASRLLNTAAPLVYDTKQFAAEKLEIRFDRQPGETWYLGFAGGTQAISLLQLDKFLDRCLALSGYLRYAAIPIRMVQAYTASGDFSQAEAIMKVLYDDETDDPRHRAIYPKFSQPPFGLTETVSIDERLMRLRLGDTLIQWAEWLFMQNTAESRRFAYRLATRLLALYEDSEFCSCGGNSAQLYSMVKQYSRSDTSRSNGRNPSGELVINVLHELDKLGASGIDRESADALRSDFTTISTEVGLVRGFRRLKEDLKRVDRTKRHSSAEANQSQARLNLVKEAEVRSLAAPELDSSSSRFNPYRDLIASRGLDLITYCVPANPIELEHKRRACLLLRHLAECRNVLGYQNDYIPPLRFDALLAQARSFASLALSAERDLLTFRERFETETFSLLQAQNALEVANATVQVESMRVALAESEIINARLQHEKVQASQAYYDQLIDAGLSDWEQRAINTARAAIDWSAFASGISFAASAGGSIATIAGGGVIGGLSGMGSTLAGVPAGVADHLRQFSAYYSMQASFERRAQEWQYQAQMSRFDVLIAENNIDQAFQRREIAVQQQVVAEIQRAGAVDALHFLNNKFLNGAMYLWMMKTVRGQYRTRLNYAIVAAYMAERALAFELQQPVNVVRFDYFDPHRDGLLGATKLETDLATLADMKLAATRRKLQLSKTISLLQVAPVELDRFKYGSEANDLGRLRFRTLLEWFDRDFPGHYLRLIKAVKVTVVALVPPIEGIKASLGTSGVSKTVIHSGSEFKERTIKRSPEFVALSAPFQATGLFVLNYEDELLLPFEGSGVETEWLFEMPKAANRFDYSTIADILITIDYSALSHDDYRAEITDRLGNTFTADRPFGFRAEFSDQWYDLNNSELDESPLEVEFSTSRTDFPSNLSNLKITDVALLFARKSDFTDAISLELSFVETSGSGSVGGSVSTNDGLISTRAGNAGNWSAMVGKSPIGIWTLKLPNTDETRAWFKTGKIEDILFVITYSAQLPAWPN